MDNDTLYLSLIVAAYCAPEICYYIGNSRLIGQRISKLLGGLENKLASKIQKTSEIIDP